MELRRATYKDQTEEMDLGFLPDGSAPYVSGDVPVEGSPGFTARVILTGAEDGEGFYLYLEVSRERTGEVEEAWGREVPSVSAGVRLAGFLEVPLSRDTLSLLSFSRGL